jgi:hypothetical protein
MLQEVAGHCTESSLEGVMRTWIRLSHHTELEDLDTHIAITHERDDLKRKKMEN